jgi:DnaJ-class molecular chaperone
MDPYKILGIPKGASPDLIREAYRKKSKKYHPDAGGDEWAFIQVEEAYRCLIGHTEGMGQWFGSPSQGATHGDEEERFEQTGETSRSNTTRGESREGHKRADHDSQEPANLFANLMGAALIGCILGLILEVDPIV